jgi:hypothetical protein
VSDFFQWCEAAGLRELNAPQRVHVAAYVESFGKTHSAPSRDKSLAAVCEDLSAYLAGWKAYFRIAETPRVLTGSG